MAVEVALGTPLAEALSNVVQPKLVEVGWTGEDDTSLAEYILLMLVNGKTQEQIATELAQDLLPDGSGTVEFAQWLFDQVTRLRGGSDQLQQNPPVSQNQAIPSFQSQDDSRTSQNGSAQQGDASMSEATNLTPDANVPTGPKAMRGGKQPGRGRMMGNINKAMDRNNDSLLHRVGGQSGNGRINAHSNNTPRGPRTNQNRMMRPQAQQQLGAAVGMPGANMQNAAGLMSTQQQMQFMAMMEEQARMMAQFMPGMTQPGMNPSFPSGPQPGRSLSDRIEAPSRGRGRGRGFGKQPYQNGHAKAKQGTEDTTMGDEDVKVDIDPTSSMEVESSQANNESGPNSICRYNLKCTRKDCPFAHQSPAAPEGTTVDVSDTCPFGAACKNHKCTGRHPSPSQKLSHQADEQCKFYPYCTNPTCPFKHPSMPMCRNGADCTVSNCKFTHLQTPCKFNPCLNPKCPFKHVEGQRGSYGDKVWTAEGDSKENEHVSERKFVDDEASEELVKPEASENQAEVMT